MSSEEEIINVRITRKQNNSGLILSDGIQLGDRSGDRNRRELMLLWCCRWRI